MEPLIWNWYAWPYLIPPATAGCNIVDRHIKIMKSYVQNPQIHVQAIKDPKLLGGPFIDLNGNYIEEVKDLIEKTKQDCADLITLNNALKEFDQILQKAALGDSLENLYCKLPKALRGLVELVYDLNNHPSIRLIEPLIYNMYYSSKHQSVALSELSDDQRQFVLSTPRLERCNEVHLNIPFADPRLDELFKMSAVPQDMATIMEMFAIPGSKQELFKSFFTTNHSLQSEDRHYNQNGVRIRYFGHACVLLQTKSLSILFDPVISYSVQTSIESRYTFLDLPDHIDYVVITHNHQDHLMFETLLQLRHKIGHIVFPGNQTGALADPSVKQILKHIGFSSLIELKEMETISLDDGEIIGLPFLGEHADLNIQSKMAYCVRLKGTKFLFAADSNNLEPYLYDHIFRSIGTIDMLFLGMECDGAPLTWLYGPLLTHPITRVYDRNRSLSGSNFNKALSIMQKSKCKKAYVYAMGQEPWLNYIMALKYSQASVQIIESNKFVQACRDQGIEAERLFGCKEWIIMP